MLHCNRTELPEGPHTPILPLSHRTQQERKKRTREPGPKEQARRKTKTHTRAEAGKKGMPGRRAGQRRVEERIKSDETTKETRGSQQPSRGRAQGRGHCKRTASTTPQQSAESGASEGQTKGNTTHHATHRRDTTHTAHTNTSAHCTWPAGPGSPPRGRAAGEGGAPELRRPPPPPRHAAPIGHASQGDSAGPPHLLTRAHSTWVVDPDSPPRGRAAGGGGAPDLRPPSQQRKAPPPGTTSRHPHSAQRRPARAHAVGPVLGPHTNTNRTRDTRVAELRLPAPRGRAAGRGTAPDTRRPSQRWQATPPGDGPQPPPWHAAPTGHASQGDRAGPPTPHTRAHSTWVVDPDSPPRGRAVRGGVVPASRRPSQQQKAPPPGTPFRHPHRAQRRPAEAHAVGQVPGPHAHTNRIRDTRVAEPPLPAPGDGRPGEGQRLTSDAPHNGGRPAPPGTAPHHPRGAQPPQGMQAKGTVLGPHTRTTAPTARG